MDILLDTSVLIDTLRSKNSRRELLAHLVEEGHSLSTTAINIAEVYVGMRSGEQTRTDSLLNSLECYEIDGQTGREAGTLVSSWAKKGKTISLPDAIVAAVAMSRGSVLLTDNRKDFPMPELKLFPAS